MSVPFMSATVGLFLAGAWFGYRWVLPGAIKVLICDFGKRFHPILTIEDYTGFFMAVILGLGISFELPILIFFLALFGIVDAKVLLRQAYPLRDSGHLPHRGDHLPAARSRSACASLPAPMLVLYFVGVALRSSFTQPGAKPKR